MTLNNFRETINTWSDLISFCYDNDIDVLNDRIYTDDDRDDFINDEIGDMMSDWHNDWRDIRDFLDGIETGYDYWERDDWGDWTGLDDGDDLFYRYREELEDYLGEDWWDREDEEETPDEVDDPYEEEPPLEQEPVSVFELLNDGDVIRKRVNDKKEADKLAAIEKTQCIINQEAENNARMKLEEEEDKKNFTYFFESYMGGNR